MSDTSERIIVVHKYSRILPGYVEVYVGCPNSACKKH